MKKIIQCAAILPCASFTCLRYLKYILNFVPICGVTCLALFSYYVFVVRWSFFLILKQQGRLLPGFLLIIVYHIMLILTMWSYYKTAFTRSPYILSILPINQPILEDDDEAESYCTRCKNIKPARSHHCAWCERCVSKMDHHCPWVGNCVGEHNYKAFVLMLFYALLFGLFNGLTLLISEYTWQKGRQDKQCFMLMVISSAIVLGVVVLFSFHVFLLFNNTTTIECGFRVADCQRCKLKPHRHDMGYRANFEAVFGKDMKYWMFPV